MPLSDWILMLTIAAVLAVALAGPALVARARSGRRLASEAAPDRGAGEPMLAAGISLLIPGAGHMLVGDWSRGALWLAGWAIVAAASQAVHGPLVVALMIVAAVDAYQVARARRDGPDARMPEGP